jgi:hypothetical protein
MVPLLPWMRDWCGRRARRGIELHFLGGVFVLRVLCLVMRVAFMVGGVCMVLEAECYASFALVRCFSYRVE